MYEYDIPDMSCGHCVSSIEKAILAADPQASANVDLTKRTAQVTTALDPQIIAVAMDDAGYPATFKAV
jgi:copper chaperone